MSTTDESSTLDEAQLQAKARQLASTIGAGGVVYLSGDLGAGKTTFVRAMLHALGVGERVKSPTYSLIESYLTAKLAIHHLDLYRIGDPGELEWLGLDDMSAAATLMLVEWPQRGHGALPRADLHVQLQHAGERRGLALRAESALGEQWLKRLEDVSGASASPQEHAADTGFERKKDL